MSGTLKAAILEQNESHTELIPAQIAYLKKNQVEVSLILNEEAHKKMDPKVLNECHQIMVFNKTGGLKDDLNIGRNIRAFLQQHDIKNLVLNTASGKFLRNLLVRIPRSINITGIIHHIDKIENSFTQKYSNTKINQYLKLGDHLTSRRKITSFYPILKTSPKLDRSPSHNELRLMIPGNIEQKRRDYQSLIDILKMGKSKLKKKVKFILAGNINKGDGPNIKKAISENGLDDYFEIFEQFIENSTFEQLALEANYILPLVHPGIQDFEKYRSTKISGSFNVAYSFRTPLFMHEAFSSIEEFKSVAKFYTEEHLIEAINQLQPEVREIEQHYAVNRKYDFDYQADSFFKTVIKKGT